MLKGTCQGARKQNCSFRNTHRLVDVSDEQPFTARLLSGLGKDTTK